jgi:hypothetical protein
VRSQSRSGAEAVSRQSHVLVVLSEKRQSRSSELRFMLLRLSHQHCARDRPFSCHITYPAELAPHHVLSKAIHVRGPGRFGDAASGRPQSICVKGHSPLSSLSGSGRITRDHHLSAGQLTIEYLSKDCVVFPAKRLTDSFSEPIQNG